MFSHIKCLLLQLYQLISFKKYIIAYIIIDNNVEFIKIFVNSIRKSKNNYINYI